MGYICCKFTKIFYKEFIFSCDRKFIEKISGLYDAWNGCEPINI